MVGGPWITDANYHAVLVMKNYLKTSALKVKPTLYVANGNSYPLPDVSIEAAGVASIDINRALTQQGIAPWAALSGYVELQYRWPWDALCATIQDADPAHSEVFTYSFRPAVSSLAPSSHGAVGSGATTPPANILEGLWWKQETNVGGFVTLSNVSPSAVDVNVQVSDRVGNAVADHALTMPAHGTKIVQLPELSSTGTPDGGLRVSYTGQDGDLLIGGGLEDPLTGYSANLAFAPSVPGSITAALSQYASLGLMAGAADPMLKFPAGTIFTPYAKVRNISAQNVLVTPTIWWMQGGAPHSARLPEVKVLPFHSGNLDVSALLSTAGLQNLNASINLVLETAGPPHALVIASGSVDQKNTYVFAVAPSAVKESVAKSLSYWSTANGDDTMVTIWNPADDPQEFTFTLFFLGGQYTLPVRLEGRVSRSFNISEIINNQIPDPEGRTIPITVHEGSAEISGSKGENQHVLVAIAAGTYNVIKATCQLYCITCEGAVRGEVSAFNLQVG